jgi:hypothetical protein
MIKGINSSGRYLTVSGGSQASTYISPGSSGAGMMRYNSNMNCIEVNDGNMWKHLESSYAMVELTPETERILDWAKKKMYEEQQLDELCKKYPGLGKARDNYETFKRLVRAEEDVPQSVQSSP